MSIYSFYASVMANYYIFFLSFESFLLKGELSTSGPGIKDMDHSWTEIFFESWGTNLHFWF